MTKPADEAGVPAAPLPLGVSIVLYRTHVEVVAPLVHQLLAQGAAHIYLVDNSPPQDDGFAGWVAPARVSVVRTGRNLGYGRGHNLAIRDSVARHRYHLVSNPDIVLGEGTLPTLVEAMNSRPDIGLCMPKVVSPQGAIHHYCKRPPTPFDILINRLAPRTWFRRRRAWFESRDMSYETENLVQCLSGCFMFFRSATLQRVGGFDERFFMYMEDFDLSLRAARVQGNLYFPGATVVHAHQSGHRKSLRLLIVAVTSTIRFFNKWGWIDTAARSRTAHAAGSVKS